MDFILSLPYILKIMLALTAIMVINRFLKNLIAAILISTTVLALWCGFGIHELINISIKSITSTPNLLLTVVIFQVIWLSSLMEASGSMSELVDVVKRNISHRAGLAILPALIGWLPMPGGALFSAPMVDQMDSEKQMEPLLKTKINYWFRHVWEYWWPLYPGVILAIDMTGLEIHTYILLQLPLSIFSVAGGVFFLLRKAPKDSLRERSSNRTGDLLEFLKLILPILIVVSVYGLSYTAIPSLASKSKYIPLIIGLSVSLVFIQTRKPVSIDKLKKIVMSIKTVKLVAIVIAVRIYGALIESPLPDGNFLMSIVREELISWNIPVLAIVMIIPFLSGLTTGIAVGFVGASFPIVINLLGPNPEQSSLMSYTVIAYGFGYIGMMLSPVHVCHLVTAEYFKTRLHQSMYRIIKPSMFVLAGSLIMGYIVTLI